MIDLMQKNWEWGEFQPGGQFGEQCVDATRYIPIKNNASKNEVDDDQ